MNKEALSKELRRRAAREASRRASSLADAARGGGSPLAAARAWQRRWRQLDRFHGGDGQFRVPVASASSAREVEQRLGITKKAHLDELQAIAQLADLDCFRALDKLASGAVSAPPRCDKCSASIDAPGAKFCPKCGCRLKRTARPQAAPPEEDREETVDETSVGPTGGEASVQEELGEKSAAATKLKPLHPLLRKLRGGAAIALGVYGGAKGAQLMSNAQQDPMRKYSGVSFKRGSRFPRLHFKPRGGSFGSVEAGMVRIKKATRKNTQRILART